MRKYMHVAGPGALVLPADFDLVGRLTDHVHNGTLDTELAAAVAYCQDELRAEDGMKPFGVTCASASADEVHAKFRMTPSLPEVISGTNKNLGNVMPACASQHHVMPGGTSQHHIAL